MVTETQPRIQLAQRRLTVRRYWRGDAAKRQKATQVGVAKALGTSATAVNVFEAGERDEFPNGKGVADYIRVLEQLEREVAAARTRAGVTR